MYLQILERQCQKQAFRCDVLSNNKSRQKCACIALCILTNEFPFFCSDPSSQKISLLASLTLALIVHYKHHDVRSTAAVL